MESDPDICDLSDWEIPKVRIVEIRSASREWITMSVSYIRNTDVYLPEVIMLNHLLLVQCLLLEDRELDGSKRYIASLH